MEFRGTTICAVRRDGKIAVAGDGQVTVGESVVFKSNARKVKRIYDDKVVIGFAGSVADAFSLSEKFEGMLQKYSGNLMRSASQLSVLTGRPWIWLPPGLLIVLTVVCLQLVGEGLRDAMDPRGRRYFSS